LKERWETLACVLAVSAAAALPASAQRGTGREEPASFINQQRVLEDRIRREQEAEIGDSWRGVFDWGGWFSSYGFLYDDGVESSRTLRRNDLRLWSRARLEGGAHEFYLRIRASYLDYNSGDSYDGNDDDLDGPNLERGLYRFDLAKAIQATGGMAPETNLIFSAGRDLVYWGTGLAMASNLDHVSLQTNVGGLELIGLAGKSVGSTPDIDLSRTATRSHRNFFGGKLAYVDSERHEPFLYALWQRDDNTEARYTPFQRFDYDSFYFGVGSTGELAPRWHYETEWVIERGHSYGDGQYRRRNDIRAWAFVNQLEYLFPGPRKARASAEYLFGSGDSGRLQSPTDSVGGNTGDFTDRSYVGFGFRDTGLSFAPLYSNLHMWRVGASLYPWPEDRRLRRLQLGTDWYLFHKHHRSGAVSDPTADLGSGFLGWEMDYYANWQVTSDLAWTARFGTFFPGDAFSDQTTRTFLLVGMTWSF
jgi:hypothetical protein